MEVPKKIVLDTTIMIGHLRGSEPRLMSTLESRAEMATTIVNAFELYPWGLPIERGQEKPFCGEGVPLHTRDTYDR